MTTADALIGHADAWQATGGMHAGQALGRDGAGAQAQDLAGAQETARRKDRLIVFFDESGLSKRPTRVRTWAPKGKTPIIQFHFNSTHMPVSAGLSRTNLMFRLHEGSIKKEQHVELRKALRMHLTQPLRNIRDDLNPGRSRQARESLDCADGEIDRAFLRLHSPDLNPVQPLVAWLERHALANFCPNSPNQLNTTARARLKSAQECPSTIAACRVPAGLW